MNYKGIIWTNHILQRMKERDLSYDDVYWVFRKPDETRKGKAEKSYKFYRNDKNRRYALVAKKNEKGEWVFLSCWTKDLYLAYKKKESKSMGFWRLVWKMLAGK
mgnify:CR=1 FL=1